MISNSSVNLVNDTAPGAIDSPILSILDFQFEQQNDNSFMFFELKMKETRNKTQSGQ